jgi:hypothetical protein
MGLFLGCNNSVSAVFDEETEDGGTIVAGSIENILCQDDFFWQSEYGNLVDIKFYLSGEVISYVNGTESSQQYGFWYFDESELTLQVSWKNESQYLVKIKSVSKNSNKIKLSDKIHEYGSDELNRLRILDDRF